jgi:SAM-dependent methyltransferase
MTTTSLPRATSITHTHLFACLNTVLQERRTNVGGAAGARILDAGCGDGALIAHVWRCLQILYPDQTIEIYGFDVLDHGVQPREYMEKTIAKLTTECPGVEWRERVAAIKTDDPWPFADDFFDVILSNQVLEHVREPERFLREHFRVLVPGGHAFHLFPLKHYVYEGHLLLPWVHRIRSWDHLCSYIDFLSRFGLGKFAEHHRATGISRAEFARRHADYVYFWTHYLVEREALDVARSVGFRASFKFSKEFYTAKLRSLLKREPRSRYGVEGRAFADSVWVKLLRYLSCVTLTLRKENVY